MAVLISVEGLERARMKLGLVISREARKEMVSHVGSAMVEFTKDHLDTMAKDRHKVSDRLGAPHSHYFEYASGRVGGVREDGSKPGVRSTKETLDSVTISIENTPGLRRAYGPMTITPKRAKALTIPIHAKSYGKRVKQLEQEGSVIFRFTSKKGNPILAEKDGEKGIRPLYVLVKKTVVPQDEGLLPTNRAYAKEALNAAKAKMKEMAI